MRRNVLHDESSRRTRAADARRKARFSAVLTSRFGALQTIAAARKLFHRGVERCRQALQNGFGAAFGVADALPNMAALKYAVSLWRRALRARTETRRGIA